MIGVLIKIFSFVAGAAIGYTFADVDLAPPLMMKHRSFWSHGPLVPVLVWFFAPGGYWAFFFLGFLPFYALHLLKDMFPKKWAGGALIKLYPIRGHLPPWMSFAWLALGASVAVWVWAVAYLNIFWR